MKFPIFSVTYILIAIPTSLYISAHSKTYFFGSINNIPLSLILWVSIDLIALIIILVEGFYIAFNVSEKK